MQGLSNETFTSIFPHNFKLKEITPVFKRKDSLNKGNYRPFSVFPRTYTILEKLMQNG